MELQLRSPSQPNGSEVMTIFLAFNTRTQYKCWFNLVSKNTDVINSGNILMTQVTHNNNIHCKTQIYFNSTCCDHEL